MKNISTILKNDNPVVVDVRDTWEFSEDHIEQAINIPLHEIPSRIQELKQLQGPFVLYCRSGNRSDAAVQILKQSGISDVYNGGGIFNMKKNSQLT